MDKFFICILEIKKIGEQETILVEGDSKVVVGWAMAQSKGAWRFDNSVHEIRDLISSTKISFSCILRVQNEMVDRLAKWAVDLDDIVISDVLPDLMSWGLGPCGFSALLYFMFISFFFNKIVIHEKKTPIVIMLRLQLI